jgi:REP element-mobilizing transposase RayT
MDEQDSESSTVIFGCLDRNAELDIKTRNLPHWFQPGAAMFITFRTADSLPRKVILRWQVELEHWLRRNKLPPRLAECVTRSSTNHLDSLLSSIPTKKQTEFKRLSNRIWHRSLDECHGACPFKDAKLADIVARALLHHDGQNYDLDSFVVMPNHVHVIVQFCTGEDFETVGQSWRRYTARCINAQTGGSGALWQPEPFDHIIRSGDQFGYLRDYIAQNPHMARLRPGEFHYWSRPV